MAYANRKMRPSAENAIEAFAQVGNAFIQLAVREPSLFRFLYLEGRSSSSAEHFNALLTDEGNPALYRKQGFASACLDFAKQIALQNNCYKMMLLTGSKEAGTLHFYEQCGYNRNDKIAFIQWLDL